MSSNWLSLLTLALLPAIVLDLAVGSRRPAGLRLTLGLLATGLMLVPFSGLSLSHRLFGLVGNPAVISSALAIGYWLRALGPASLRRFDRQIVGLALLVVLVALVFYPLALGVSLVDPYGHGYYPTVLTAVLLTMVIAALLSGWTLVAALLALAYAGFAAGLLESDNLWDYLFDPVLVVVASILVVRARAMIRETRWQSLFPGRFTWGVLLVIAVFLAFALVLSRVNPEIFVSEFTVEDGFVEWMSSIALFGACGYAFWRFLRVRHRFGWPGKAVLLFVALVALFGAGEEISWGQRVFGIATPEALRERNAQEEMNLHNLTFEWQGRQVKINKLVFGRGLALALITYLLVMGPLYRRREGFRRFIDRWAIPIATTTQTVAYIAVVAFVELLIDSPKRGEMTEFAGALVFMLNVMFPLNRRIYGEDYGRNPG